MSALVNLVRESPGVVSLVLNRVDKMNALSSSLVDELTAAVAAIATEAAALSVRAVVLRSASPKSFCAGADLAERLGLDVPGVHEALARLRTLMDGIEAIPCPVIAAIEGGALGGGCEMALACDLRVASKKALLGLTETKLAIIPGAGGTQRLSRIVGEARAKELIYLAKLVGGEEAARIGLVNACVEDPVATALEWARAIAAHGPIAVPAAKKSIQGGRDLPLVKALDHERACYQPCLDSQDRIEGLKAFFEKRPPVYKGN